MELQPDTQTDAQPLLEQHGRANDGLEGIELQAARRFRETFGNLYPEPAGAPLRYSVKIHNGEPRSPGNTGDSPAAAPQPILGSYAPFPYGHAPVPRGWEPTSDNPVFLSVPPLYDSDTVVDQTQAPPPVDAGDDRGCCPTTRSPPPFRQEPMPLKRRLAGCFLLAFLGVHSFFFFYTWAFLPDQLQTPRFVVVAIYLSSYAGFLLFTMHEARDSKLGRMMRADVVGIERVAGFLDDRSSDVAPGIEFLAILPGTDDQPQRQEWFYDQHEDVPPPMEDVISHIAQLVSRFGMVRLRLPVRATLADKRTKGDFITALHKFYLRWPNHNLAVEVLPQDYLVVVSRAGTGLPLHFRILRVLYSASVYLTLSWVVRIVVLLFFPHLVDLAYSPVFCHHKRLVSRATGA